MKYIFLRGSFVLFMASCAPKKDKEQTANYHLSGDTVVIAANSNLQHKIKVDTVAEIPYRMRLSSAGTVKAIPNFYADIAPPFSGRVLKVFLKLGMKVDPGTPLFEMVSAEFIETQKNFFAAKSELKMAGLNLKRQQDLKKNEVGSSKDLEEAEVAYELILKEYENLKAALKIYQTDPEKMVLGQPLIVRSPIKGEVIQNELVTGHYLKSDEVPHAKIAELNKVWIAGQVKEKDIRFIRQGDDTTIEIAAYPGRKITGKVYHVDELVDEETRSVKVLIECENKDYTLKPGMYVTVTFKDSPQNTAVVPVKSVLQMNDSSFVFLQTTPGSFVRRKVQTAATDEGRMVILSGLKPGETIVSEGGFYLLEAK
ncbi:efflux RND transporter periplasmic adaptor subunit [Pedobacter steynii]|uniref:Uncharacterized protein n=1 Tax=Pedobacter steynii TaxID=430522 RepID=A0A1D7QPA4_9SPHI|nr:efflux RND transporter periplasmic adaptor subunit [Pedobacter steynii]AOM80506.1 hypothetical protein BFS30_27115 [Pedobacter steynii]